MKTISSVTRTLALIAVVAGAGVGCGGEHAANPPSTPVVITPPTGPVPDWLMAVRPLKHGGWINALPSPDGRTVLAQWLAECEIPIAYFVPVRGRVARPVASGPSGPAESVAITWNTDGRAVVFFPSGSCGAGIEKPGLTLVALDGRREFITDSVSDPENWR